jgi:radical SAM/Cys-rich protein
VRFDTAIQAASGSPLRRGAVHTLQVNLTARCNLACKHCHVDSSPSRSEGIDARVARRIVELLERSRAVRCLDLTGGAPEMSPHFRELVEVGRRLGLEVIDRCNLTIFEEPGYGDLPEFLAHQGVTVVASLPCYTAERVEAQRGRGVFDPSIAGLQRLNALGYGAGARALDLVYNPVEPELPPDQSELEGRYRAELRRRFGIEFRRLYAIANMPIRRYAQALQRAGQLSDYHALLVNSFNPHTVEGLMCRSLVSVGYDGRLHDCDFNQQLGLGLANARLDLWDVKDLDELAGSRIATDRHCFGCTAGAGSSCGGALA